MPRMFDAVRDIASDILAALGTSPYPLGFFDSIYATELDCAVMLDKPPY